MSIIDESQVIIEMLCRDKWRDEWIHQINTDKLIKIAKKNKVLSTLASYIYTHGLESHFKETKALKVFKEALLLNERDIVVYKRTLKILNKAFVDKGMEFVLLKGLSLPVGNPRDMGDLDILIRPEELLESIDLMEDLGFVYTGDKRNRYMQKNEIRNWSKLLRWSNQFEFLDEKTGLLVEIHTNFFESYRVYRLDLDPFLSKVDEIRSRAVFSEELGCKVLCREDMIWLLSIHNSIKSSPANKYFLLRNLLDLENLLGSEDIDWHVIFERAEETGTLAFVQYTLEMGQKFIPSLCLDEVIEIGQKQLRKGEKVLISNMHNCYYNLAMENHLKIVLFRILLPFVLKSKLKYRIQSLLLFPVIFDPRWKLRYTYGFPKKSPLVYIAYLLEPFHWVYLAINKRKFRASEF